ncbi:prenyltransferase/squalene oxidase repeat-containing protein [Nesterenkonia ebinurensis]|uniref:prenyltransferase/squalene oxidase repeat-containing protein n=1 Tax=Nesterenkonia ebinurensis TaxID=2608252 RepID=UPI00123CEC5F|nr:prenyltransferase/squalene oxidase repeat-containing protein [Nesterenkonia ebinurensis]
MNTTSTAIDWLMAGDPAIRWQTMRDLLGSPQAALRAERSKVEDQGWGARLLSLQDQDGQWAGGAYLPSDFAWEQMRSEGQPWTATSWALTELRELGLDPGSPSARRTVTLVGENSRWDHDGQPYWEGEVEECINGRTVAQGAYFGVDVAPIVERLVSQRMEDGGWNCERENGSVRSSFDSTINVLEGLLEFERSTGGTADSRGARAAGEEYLLTRGLMHRRSTGELVDQEYLDFRYPSRWRYDLLRVLDYFREASLFAGTLPDPRLADAVEYVRSRQQPEGTWHLDKTYRGRSWFQMDPGAGQPSRWITLKALRVLHWWESP